MSARVLTVCQASGQVKLLQEKVVTLHYVQSALVTINLCASSLSQPKREENNLQKYQRRTTNEAQECHHFILLLFVYFFAHFM